MKKLTIIVSMFLFSLLVGCSTCEPVQMIEYENIETEVFKIEETETEDKAKDDKENRGAWLDKILATYENVETIEDFEDEIPTGKKVKGFYNNSALPKLKAQVEEKLKDSSEYNKHEIVVLDDKVSISYGEFEYPEFEAKIDDNKMYLTYRYYDFLLCERELIDSLILCFDDSLQTSFCLELSNSLAFTSNIYDLYKGMKIKTDSGYKIVGDWIEAYGIITRYEIEIDENNPNANCVRFTLIKKEDH